jgi:hypothetical protein
MRDVVMREEYPDGAARETLACGHVLYLTKSKKASGARRCLLCVRSAARRRPHAQQR